MAAEENRLLFAFVVTRFQIEDIIAQDASGVVFRALDKNTNEPVCVRRFFPFGAEGGGLDAEEQVAYRMAVNRLAEIRHATFRSVVTGGCDPHDGMPFFASEWIEGESLAQRLQTGFLSPMEVIEVIHGAFDAAEVLSQMLEEQAVWIDTHLSAIFAGIGQPGRRFVFTISPTQWLGDHERRRSLAPIAKLAEELLGWRNRLVADQAGNGLGAWVKWVKLYAQSATLAEARQALVTATTPVAIPKGSPTAPLAVRPQPTKPMLAKRVPGMETARVSNSGVRS